MFFMQQAYYDARPCYVTTPKGDKTHKFRSRHRKKRATAFVGLSLLISITIVYYLA